MSVRASVLMLVLLLSLAGSGRAQMVPSPSGRGPSPLLFVRFSGPPGLRTTFYQGQARGRAFDAPVVVGLRPGYLYRIQLSHLARSPGTSIYPTLEVRGSLHLPPRLGAAAYPAPVVLTEADLDVIMSGGLVTKVVYLEHPDRAPPAPSPVDQPIERDLPPGRNLLAEAWAFGRPVLIVRLGGRLLVSEEELAHESVHGTILFPGEKVLTPASRPPCVLCDPRPFHDPFLGPRPPEEECLHDGGDHGLPAGIDGDGQLYGLDPEDTVAEYTDSRGRRRITCSNRVCVCVPRYIVLRSETPLGRYDSVVGPSDTRRVQNQQRIEVQTPPLQALTYEQLRGLNGRQRPSINEIIAAPGALVRVTVLDAIDVPLGPLVLIGTPAARTLTQIQRERLLKQLEFSRELSTRVNAQGLVEVIATTVVGRIESGPQVVRGEVETRDLTVCCNEVPCPPDKPLVLVKCADRCSAQVGDVVTFTLRYSNHGGRPITDVAVTDSLTTRLEYVAGSAQADRPAVFTIQDNEAGSAILRWEISGRLLPGQSGVLRFQARVR
jgi:uncharacterized repeat protein (TIGR01451 family)